MEDNDIQPIGPITVLQAFEAAEAKVVRLQKINSSLVDTHGTWLILNSRLKTELDEAHDAMSHDQTGVLWAKRDGAEALATQAEAFARERSGWEAALLVAHEPAREARREAFDLGRENRELRAQVRDLTAAAHQ